LVRLLSFLKKLFFGLKELKKQNKKKLLEFWIFQIPLIKTVTNQFSTKHETDKFGVSFLLRHFGMARFWFPVKKMHTSRFSDRNKLPIDQCHLGVPSGAFKNDFLAYGTFGALCTYLSLRLTLSPNGLKQAST
jgi:hypothetical protein